MISIIVPIYRVEKYLPKCIESLMAQTYSDLEIILVDDGSPDGCGRICDEYAALDNRLIVIHQQNAGVSAARNAGLKAASGEYIGFCDPDDWAAHNMYEELVAAMEQNDADLAICGYNYYDEQYQVDTTRLYAEREIEVIDQKTLMDRLADMPPSIRHGVWNKLFKYNLLHRIKFDKKLKSSEDLKFLNEYILKVKKAAVVHKPLYQNLVRSSSATHGGLSVQSLADSFAVHEQMYQMAIDAYPELKDRALAFLMDVLVLKYNEATRSFLKIPAREQTAAEARLEEMRRSIHRYAWRALTDREIWWKTRIAYLILR